jgi:hypothetical protein
VFFVVKKEFLEVANSKTFAKRKLIIDNRQPVSAIAGQAFVTNQVVRTPD